MANLNALTESDIAQRLIDLPPSRYSELPPGYPEKPIRPAAVLVPLFRHENGWHLLYTARAVHLSNHGGQVSFPGGGSDPEDGSPEATALREAEEELGIQPADVRILGRLSPMITISYYRVTPVVGVMPFPYAFRVATGEVAQVLSLPLTWLANSHNRREFTLPNGWPLNFYLPNSGQVLWGATARMTLEFIEALER